MTDPQQDNNSANGKNGGGKRSLTAWIGFGLVMGIAVGASIGAATDDMGTWVGVGVGIGMGYGAAVAAIQNRRKRG